MLSITNLRLAPHSQMLPSLSFATGQIHVILGRNRSGKSALCRLLAGLPTAATGQVSFNGDNWQSLGPRQRSVALVYQAFINYPHWSVADNLGSPLKAQGLRPEQIAERVTDLAMRLQLTELLSRKPAELSGGQQQRLAIGRALAKGSELLLLDEPLVNLDYKLREVLELELLDLLKASGATVLYTSSDPQDALGLADNLVLLAQHEVVQVGAPLSLYQQPVNALAADLLSDPGVNPLLRDGVRAYVRPEHLLLQQQVAATGEEQWQRFELLVDALETNGSHTFVHGRVEDQHWIAKLLGLPQLQLHKPLSLYARQADILQVPDSNSG